MEENKKTLLSEFPEIAKEWDYEKNGNLTPDMVTPRSNKRVFWICPTCHHSYQSNINNRTAPHVLANKTKKCPICLGRIIIPGFNSLKALYPKIIEEEWDYGLNTVDPDTIPPKNNSKYWWKCNKGHESYLSRVNNKINNNGGNCPFCSHQKISIEKSLFIINPSLSREWHPTKNGVLDPKDVFANSNKKAWWLCPICKHEWKAAIYSRNSGVGCPNCSKGQHTSFPEQVILFYVKKLFPDAINGYKCGDKKQEIDIYIPSIELGIEYDGGYYHNKSKRVNNDILKTKYIAENGIRLVRFREQGCPDLGNVPCEIIKVKYEKTWSDISTKLQIFLDRLSCEYNLPKIQVELANDWKSIWENQYYLPYEKSFAYYLDEQKAKGTIWNALWDYEANAPITPEMVRPSSGMYVNWICPKNSLHKWSAPLYSIINGCGCARCAKRHHYTTDEYIGEAKKIHGGKYDYSQVVYVNTHTPVKIICSKHGVFEQNPNRHLQGAGCKFCAGTAGYNPADSLQKNYPELAKEWDYDKNLEEYGVTPDTVSYHDTRNFWWKCNNGKPHSYKAKFHPRINRNSGCAVCAGKQVSYDTCLEFLRPDLISEWSPDNKLSPAEVNIGSEKRVLWKCPNPNHPQYETMVISRVKSKYGCTLCAREYNAINRRKKK